MNKRIEALLNELNQEVLGREDIVRISLASLFVGGHILIEDVPGAGKTTLSAALSQVTGLDFKRIQFTSDLLPSDILGFLFLDKNVNEFIFKKGPIFTDILLADEINRASSKTQSAFLQAMEEREVSIENEHFQLSPLFCVIATQNYKDQVGTHQLPESQMDRFSISLNLGQNTRDVEKEILKRNHGAKRKLLSVISHEEFLKIAEEIRNVEVAEKSYDIILDILELFRKEHSSDISIRAAQDLKRISKAIAFFAGRNFVTPADIFFVAPFVFSHRIIKDNTIGHGFEKSKSSLQKISEFL
ncbi:MoxR family ATPase [Bacteriovorax sp. Seq25_V]|uniref:AAA family ATPase n=1 Tax=Bacteriovorax sp. Seq25_V TaxID=1201288 RepID=UPI00038A4B9A|nr:AAA family ATPase [Bacteriovorax sp. Seq25_V]EQC43938.1 ATPase, AAA family [Bacteriovorax sp. Seq25_V]